MIQFNLLPNVKLEYIKVRRAKRLVMFIAALITGVSLTILILLFMVVHVFQKQHLKNIAEDIARDSQTLKKTPDIEKILTIQKQLISLPALHQQKPQASRLFDYIKQITPPNITIAQFDINLVENTAKITGSAAALNDVNRFIDTIKFTEYTIGNPEVLNTTVFNRGEHESAFSGVVLSSFSRTGENAAYTIDLKFDPIIFKITLDNPETTDKDESTDVVKLIIPNIITTRSQLEKPGPLFKELPDKKEEGN